MPDTPAFRSTPAPCQYKRLPVPLLPVVSALQKRNDRDIHQEEITRLEAELQVLQRRIVDASESSVLVSEENERAH